MIMSLVCSNISIIIFVLALPLSTIASQAAINGGDGEWELLLNSSGVVAMHMALTHYNTVIMFDQTSAGASGYRLRNHTAGRTCSDDPSCWAHSVEYDIGSNTIRPLTISTDTWCSSGGFFSSGELAQTGGHGDGARRIRYFDPCMNHQCDWRELDTFLTEPRWYATNQVLPGGDRMIVIGGLDAYNYEFVPKSPGEGAYELPFLQQTLGRSEYDNLYPFVHLLPDGNIFVFANRKSILLDYRANRVLRTFPSIPGEGPRSYPGTGSSVMLPLDHAEEYLKAEVMVCGGSADGAFRAAGNKEFWPALSSCGRITITDEDPKWVMEEMPGRRVMPDMLILPSGDILIVNGAMNGAAGWDRAAYPSYSPYLYNPKHRVGERFITLQPSKIARLYHSSGTVLPDGRVLVAGSNPHRTYVFAGATYPTELRVEAFSPPYLNKVFDSRRPTRISIQFPNKGSTINYGALFYVSFQIEEKIVRTDGDQLAFYAYAPPFTTHSVSMNQRMLKLECRAVREVGNGRRWIGTLVAPPSGTVAPAGYYMFAVVNGGIPSRSAWLRFGNV